MPLAPFPPRGKVRLGGQHQARRISVPFGNTSLGYAPLQGIAKPPNLGPAHAPQSR